MHLLAHTQTSYASAVRERLGKGEQLAALLYKEWYRKGTLCGEHPAFSNAQVLLERIVEVTDASLSVCKEGLKEGGTEKFLLQLEEGWVVEAVAIPMKYGYTLCVSSQVGCRMGCVFCETGKMGLLRQLSVEEITAQLYHATRTLGYAIRNVVFMGMGEAFDNCEAVFKAIEVMSDPAGFGIAKSRITLSTSGRVDGIRRMMREIDPAVNLAVSINAAHDRLRSKLMPINRKVALEELHATLRDYCAHPRRELLLSYVLLKGVNDAVADAEALAAYVEGLRAKVNLIPYNPQRVARFETPDVSSVEAFARQLRQRGVPTLFRLTKGQRIMAACGQLGKKIEREFSMEYNDGQTKRDYGTRS